MVWCTLVRDTCRCGPCRNRAGTRVGTNPTKSHTSGDRRACANRPPLVAHRGAWLGEGGRHPDGPDKGPSRMSSGPKSGRRGGGETRRRRFRRLPEARGAIRRLRQPCLVLLQQCSPGGNWGPALRTATRSCHVPIHRPRAHSPARLGWPGPVMPRPSQNPRHVPILRAQGRGPCPDRMPGPLSHFIRFPTGQHGPSSRRH